MPGGGRLSFQAAGVAIGEDGDAAGEPLGPGAYVKLVVRDTGRGMDAETRDRAFEPFFTTKEVGEGTGLGLSTVHGIVKQSGGHVSLASEPGRGTEVVVLPRAPGAGRRSETILLVDDEAQVRAVAREILAGAGYSVLEAAGAAVALEICAGHAGPIALLMTDVLLPGMTGSGLGREARRTRPEMKVLCVEKPLTADHLTRQVREALDGGA
jgi:CheY-like chemotaxis protein